MEQKSLVLLVEDEKGIRNFISTVLEVNGYRALEAKNGKEALELFTSRCPDLILLDLGLPDMDGTEVLETIRGWSQVPIIVVSARGHEREKVEALDRGADDYITKPFGTSELLARIRTAMRHQQVMVNVPDRTTFSVGDLIIDFDKRIITLEGEPIHFTPIEYKILELLTKYPGKVVTYDQIIKEIWGPYTNENQTLRVNMANIRRKIEINPAEPKYILTEVGVGYRFVDEI
ncbi:MAG: response regulator transcription factor [Eubacterium sp.]